MKQQETRTLPVKLLPTEQLERGKTLSERVEKLKDMKVRHKEVAADMKAAEAKQETLVHEMARITRSGQEPRQVECEARPVLSERMMEWYRLDTGELVESRPLSREELAELSQGDLFSRQH